MATYPVITQEEDESLLTPINANAVSRAADGTVRATVNYSDTAYNGTIVHPYVTDAEKSTLMTFYDNNKALSFTFAWPHDSTNYTMVFYGEPIVKRNSPDSWRIVVNMTGSKT